MILHSFFFITLENSVLPTHHQLDWPPFRGLVLLVIGGSWTEQPGSMPQLLESPIRDHETGSGNNLDSQAIQLVECLPGMHEALGLIPQHLASMCGGMCL